MSVQSASYRNFTGTGAENYQRYFVPAIAEPVSDTLLRAAQLRTGERVLDVACGTGVIARLAADQVGETGGVTGIDVSPEMIEVARTTGSDAPVTIDWKVSDAASLPLRDASFDVVLCQMGLMFIEDKAGALAEMRRVLAPGGRVVLNTPGSIQPAFEAMEDAITHHINPDLGKFVRAVFSLHDPNAVGGLLLGAGFSDVSAAVSTATLQLPPPAEFLWQYINLTPMGPFVSEASEEAKLAMERQAVAGMEPFVAGPKTLIEQPMVVATGRA